jgi:Na+-transporting NADH:ubiquinone oxidoreductase subunit C
MKINKESNGYVFGFTITLIAVVAIVLASLATGLKEKKEINGIAKKRMDILSAIQIASTRETADKVFNQYIKSTVVINSQGQVLEGEDAFLIDVKAQDRDKQLKDDQKKYPLFLAEKDGEKLFIIPVVGKGLWGPIWGYAAMKEDMRTVYGVSFGHKGETPGLGAEIEQKFFTDLWVGKAFADASMNFTPIKVVKKGSGVDPSQQVDGITGGTITSKGVEEMMNRTMEIYVNYFKTL